MLSLQVGFGVYHTYIKRIPKREATYAAMEGISTWGGLSCIFVVRFKTEDVELLHERKQKLHFDQSAPDLCMRCKTNIMPMDCLWKWNYYHQILVIKIINLFTCKFNKNNCNASISRSLWNICGWSVLHCPVRIILGLVLLSNKHINTYICACVYMQHTCMHVCMYIYAHV